MAAVQDGPEPSLFPRIAWYQPDKTRLTGLVEQWRSLIEAEGNTPEHVSERHFEVTRILDLTGWSLQDTAVQIALGSLCAGTLNLSNRTYNKHLSAMRNLTKWLARPSAQEIPFDPLAELKPRKVKKDRRREREAFTDPQYGQLISAMMASPRAYCGIAGPDRAECYHGAACTGMRSDTVSVVEVGQFSLEGAMAVLLLRAEQVKDGDDLVVPIQADSAARLRRYFTGKMPGTRAFRMPKEKWRRSEMLQLDMAEAGVPYCEKIKMASGRFRFRNVLDFHSFRHTFVTRCYAAGVNGSFIQGWVGHSTEELTRKVYRHLIPSDSAAAMQRVPPLPGTRAS